MFMFKKIIYKNFVDSEKVSKMCGFNIHEVFNTYNFDYEDLFKLKNVLIALGLISNDFEISKLLDKVNY